MTYINGVAQPGVASFQRCWLLEWRAFLRWFDKWSNGVNKGVAQYRSNKGIHLWQKLFSGTKHIFFQTCLGTSLISNKLEPCHSSHLHTTWNHGFQMLRRGKWVQHTQCYALPPATQSPSLPKKLRRPAWRASGCSMPVPTACTKQHITWPKSFGKFMFGFRFNITFDLSSASHPPAGSWWFLDDVPWICQNWELQYFMLKKLLCTKLTAVSLETC